MKNKLVLIIVVVVSICVLFVIVINIIDHFKYRYVPPQGDEETYNLTEEEVARINANSNMLGCTLLADAPEGAMTAIPKGIRNFDDGNYFMCFPYRKRSCITSIRLYSEEADIYGISVGDNIEEASQISLEKGYIVSEYSLPDKKRFDKYYISISINYDSSQTITGIGIDVNDPEVKMIF